MPTYISLMNFTGDGIGNLDDSPARLDDAQALVESLGGEMHGFYLTMGAYDLVAIADFPDDDAAAKALLRIGQAGAVSSQTMRAWPEADYRDLVASLP